MKSIKINEPFELVTLDIISPISPVSKNGWYIFVMVDHCTKMVDLTAGKTQTAKEAAKVLFEYCCKYSSPKYILTDQGKCFESELFKELAELLDIVKSRTNPYYPQGDGNTERFNRTLEGMLRCFIEENLEEWDE